MKVGILVFDGADELDVVGPFRVLAAVGWDVGLVAHADSAVVLANGLTVKPSHTFDDGTAFDILVVPGGSSEDAAVGRRSQQRNDRTLAFVRSGSGDARVVASVCTGAFILASAGLLAGRRGNTHWMYRDELIGLMKERGEDFELVPERVVWDEDVVTGGGVTSGIDIALDIIERELGHDVRARVEAGLEITTPTS